MDKILEKLKQNWIVVWFVVAALSLSIMSGFAIYTRVTIAKRVVSTQAGASSLFSSSHMNNGGMKTIEPVTDNTQNASITVNIYNYAYPKEAVYRNEDTQYDLVATIGTIDSSDNFVPLSDASALTDLTYSVTYGSQTFTFGASGLTHTFSGCVIQGEGAHDNQVTLVFDKSELGNTPNEYCIKIEANPYDSGLQNLTGYVMVRYTKQASAGWSGELEELDTNKDYDGFNYYLEGNGKGKLTFRWNPTYVSINKDFLNNRNNKFYYKDNDNYVAYQAAPVEADLTSVNGMVSLTIEVDSTKQNRYEIQFYKTNKTNDYTAAVVKEDYLPDTAPSDWVADVTP